jgi:hypothetical protein
MAILRFGYPLLCDHAPVFLSAHLELKRRDVVFHANDMAGIVGISITAVQITKIVLASGPDFRPDLAVVVVVVVARVMVTAA